MLYFQSEIRKKLSQTMATVKEENRKAGNLYMAENKTKEGVVTLPSGLQYKILKAGDGNVPTETSTVEVHYRGTLVNGTEFDSSARGGKPASFEVSKLIPGWKEALKLMPAGSKWQVVVPPHLAYGDRGMGRDIGPAATLLFEVELLSVK